MSEKQGKKRGRKPKSGVQREEGTDIRAMLRHGGNHAWRITRLRALIREHETEAKKRQQKLLERWRKEGTARDDVSEQQQLEEWHLPDNFLSARAAENQARARAVKRVSVKRVDAEWNKLRAKRKGEPPSRKGWLAALDKLGLRAEQPDEITSLWRRVVAEFERAVLSGNADWLKGQADAISGPLPVDDNFGRFDAAVFRQLEMAFWGTRAEERKDNPNIEDATLSPAGKHVACTSRPILDSLETRTETLRDGTKRLYVEGRPFNGTRRKGLALEAIERLAKRHGFKLVPRIKKPSPHEASFF
jgi:hypothetical protein